MRSIMLSRAAHMALYAESLREIGIPVERELALAGLPATLEEQPDYYLPVILATNFLYKMERKEGIKDFGFLASQKLALGSLGADLRVAVHQVPTLIDGLLLLSRLAHLEYTNVSVSVVPRGDSIRICSDLVGNQEFDGLQYVEWLQNFTAITIVRQFAGPQWYPTEIAFKSRFSPSPRALERFSKTRFLTGEKTAWIEVPASLQNLPPLISRYGQRPNEAPNWIGQLPAEPKLDFPGSLELALRAYVAEGPPSIQFAANIAGTSVRTLQRCLARYGLSYSDLVQQARFATAARLLENPDTKVIDVAYSVGYEDPSHFTRAFRRLAGVSPREYRRYLAIHPLESCVPLQQ